MPGQLRLIAQAANFLTNGQGTPKDKLVHGGKLIWAATVLSDDWTPELLKRAHSIYQDLLKGGILTKAVEQMDENTAAKCLKQLTKDTVELAAEIEQANRQEHPHK